MVSKQGYPSISNYHLPNEVSFYSSKCPFSCFSGQCPMILDYSLDSFIFALLITLFELTKYSVCLYLTLYLLSFFHKLTFGFPCICYLLNVLKQSPNQSAQEALMFFFVCICNICNKKYSRCYNFVYHFFDTCLTLNIC